MHLNPELRLVKTKHFERLVSFVLAEDNQILVKAPWRTKQNLLSVQLILESKEDEMVSEILDAKLLFRLPQWSKSPSHNLNT